MVKTLERETTCKIHNVRVETLKVTPDITIESCPECKKEMEVKSLEKERIEREKELKLRQEKINEELQNSMLAPRFWTKNIENYETTKEGQLKALNTAKWFTKNFETCVGLILTGNTGTGKNHLASGIVQKVIHKGNTVLFTEAIKIIRAIKESWKKENESETQVIKKFISPDLLVIDEVGVQFGTSTEAMFLTEIINDRYNWLRPTILIGNITIKELEKLIGFRAVDRFREGGRVIVFDWESYRKKR